MRSIDSELMDQAHDEARVLLTEDKDFGWLAYVARARSAGVVLVRFPASARKRLAADIIQLVEQRGAELPGSFVVLTPGSARISRVPEEE